MKELLDLVAQFRVDYMNAPLYGGYSRTLKKKIPAKSQVQSAFIEDLQMMAKVCVLLDDGADVKDKIEAILSEFE